MTKLHHRIPIRIRHHWRLLVAAVVLLVLTIGVLGAYRVRPIVLAGGDEDTEKSTVDIAGTVDLFAHDLAHRVAVRFPKDGYDRMIADFLAANEKSYVEADVVIDGTSIPSVGIRLKGNSTLMALRRGTTGNGRGTTTALSADEPENLPWLMSFDHFVKDRTYQGREQLAVRPEDRSGATVNEALALTLVGLAGEPTQRYTYTTFTVNDRSSVSRLMIEVPDDGFADDLGRGVLYKALATGAFRYQGDDPTAYTDDFDQINRKHSRDLDPVIKLLAWVDRASDAEFTADLHSYVDVDSFATYAALQNLLLNFDDMAGPGKNYYLWYDLDDKRFTVLTWDLNLALSGDPAQGPFDAGRRIGGGGPVQGGPIPGGTVQGGPVPGGTVQGGPVPGGTVQGGPVPGGFGGPTVGNRLKERFLALFVDEYKQAYRAAYQRLFASGAALRALTDVTAGTRAMAGDAAVAEQGAQAAALRTLIESRTRSLATNSVITGT